MKIAYYRDEQLIWPDTFEKATFSG